jgi:hypothetical protein
MYKRESVCLSKIMTIREKCLKGTRIPYQKSEFV